MYLQPDNLVSRTNTMQAIGAADKANNLQESSDLIDY